jgi:anti-sigma-K factor RskA
MTNSTQHTEHFENLCAAYVLNALDLEEQQEFEQLLQEGNEEQMQTFYELRSAANQLAFTTERAEPSLAVKKQLMKRIKADTDTSGTAATVTDIKESSSNRSALAMAASFALLLITLALVFYAFNLNSEINNKEELITQREAEITELKNEVQQKEELLSILEARTVDLIVMSGLEVNPNGYGKVIWDPEKKQALLQVSNLPAVPAGKDYQLWLFKNNKPLPSGVFAVNDPSKDSFFKIEQMADANEQNANAFAITLEPEGGSPQPTGDIYLSGNVERDAN